MRADATLDTSDFFRQDVVMPGQNWERLGDYVVARRTALGKLENGKRVSASTLGAVENHLGWAPGSCRRILSGGEPVLASASGGPARYEDPTLQHIAETPGLPPDVVRGLIALARNWREQEDEPGEPVRRRA